jgi:arylsulfatase A-like enzyme
MTDERGETTRREFLGGAAAVTLAAMSGCAMNPGKRGGPRPNVLFVFADQLRADVCGGYGDPDLKNIRTPHIDELASQGVTFTHALSTTPKCTPYRGMLMTGRHPTHTGLVVNFVNASPQQNPNCIGNLFSRAGYDTGFIGKWHLAAGGWRNPGKSDHPDSDMSFVPPGPARLGFDHWEAYNFHVDFNHYWYYRDEEKKCYSERYETDTQVDQAIRFMEERKRSGRPFFLTVAPHPPHPPFRESHIPKGYLDQVPEKLKWSPNVPGEHREKQAERRRFYLAMCKNMDDNIGRLMRFLDASGLGENTLVVFSSDHGEMHGSHGRYNKKVPYAESVDIPLIMRWPGTIPAGRRESALYTPMDHLPTLCGLAGLEIPGEVDGIDLSAAALGRGKVDRKEVLMATYVSGYNTFTTEKPFREWRGVHTGRYTYIRWLGGTERPEELYDSESDPYQMQNLVGDPSHAERLDYLRKRLGELMAEAHDEFEPGTHYAKWYDKDRNLIRTGLGPVGA